MHKAPGSKKSGSNWFVRNGKTIIAGLVFLFVAFPQWVQMSWAFFNSEPLLPWLAKNGIKMPPFSVHWISVPAGLIVAGTIYWWEGQRSKRLEKEKKDLMLLVDLQSDDGNVCNALHTYKIEVQNKAATPAQNVKIELVSIWPIPDKMKDFKFPINLPSRDLNRIINPEAKLYFDFCSILVGAEKRVVTFSSEGGAIASFEETIGDVLKETGYREFRTENYLIEQTPVQGVLDNDKYWLDIRISAIDRPVLNRRIRLRLIPTDFDLWGGNNWFPGGFFFHIVP